PHGHRLDLRVQAIDKHGNRIVELGTSDVPIVITGAGPEPVAVTPPPPEALATVTTPTKIVKHSEPPPHERPVVLRWWLWGAVAVAFGGATTYLGITTLNTKSQLETVVANSSTHVYDPDASVLAARLHHEVLGLNIGFGVTGAFAVGAAILFITRPHAEHRVAIVPTSGGASVVFGGA